LVKIARPRPHGEAAISEWTSAELRRTGHIRVSWTSSRYRELSLNKNKSFTLAVILEGLKLSWRLPLSKNIRPFRAYLNAIPFELQQNNSIGPPKAIKVTGDHGSPVSNMCRAKSFRSYTKIK
jgi:hypothetical protein